MNGSVKGETRFLVSRPISQHKREHGCADLACGPILRTATGERLALAEAMMLALMVAALLAG